jgi:superfamily II DNA or RNA helicase
VLGGLLKSFPEEYTPNSAQVKLLKNIDQAFNDGYKFVVCNAPTGSGKSFISKHLQMLQKNHRKILKILITSYTAFKIDQTGSYTHEEECEDEECSW